MIFGEVRAAAQDALHGGAYTYAGNPRPCVWQNYSESRHVAVYCNALSHLEGLMDFLDNATWCDHIHLPEAPSDSEDAERLFRLHGLVFLAWEECIADLRLIRGAARRGLKKGDKVEAPAESLMGFVNHVWKHRNLDGLGASAFHEQHHHGPYLFADLPGFRRALPSNGSYVAIGYSTPVTAPTPLTLLVPSLVSAMSALSTALRGTSAILKDPTARGRVVDAYGSVQL